MKSPPMAARYAAAVSATCCTLLLCSCATQRPLPAPVPLQGDVTVGCYYFPGWFSPERWTPIKEYGGPTPLLGYYDESNPRVADTHIRWAVEHGIGFFAFDWYYDHERGTVSVHNAALEAGFLESRYRNLMRFCIFWCNESDSARRVTPEHLLTLAKVLEDRYFHRENYLRINGKPVVFISRPHFLLEALGVDGTAAAFAAMATQAGEDGIVFIANSGDRSADMKAAGFSAISGYNYATVGVPDCAGKSASYDDMITGYTSVWERLSGQRDLPYIPPLSPGWDSRPWYGERGFVRTGATPEKFEGMCRAVLPYLDPTLKMAIIECWNEFGEGSYIEPTEEYGFGWLQAVRRAFFPTAPELAAPYLLPASVRAGLAFPDVPAFVDREIAAQGGNLVFNPGFERQYGWLYYDGGPAAPVTDAPKSGAFCLRVPAARGGAKSAFHIPVSQRSAYRLSVWLRGAAGVKCALFSKDKRWLGRYVELGSCADGGGWRWFENTFTIDDPEAAFFNVEITAHGGEACADDVGVYEVKR